MLWGRLGIIPLASGFSCSLTWQASEGFGGYCESCSIVHSGWQHGAICLIIITVFVSCSLSLCWLSWYDGNIWSTVFLSHFCVTTSSTFSSIGISKKNIYIHTSIRYFSHSERWESSPSNLKYLRIAIRWYDLKKKKKIDTIKASKILSCCLQTDLRDFTSDFFVLSQFHVWVFVDAT